MKLLTTLWPLSAACYAVGTCDLLTNLIPAFSYQGTIQIFYIVNVLSALTLISGLFFQNDLVIEAYLFYYLLFLLAFGVPLLLIPAVYPNVFHCPFMSTTWAFLVLRLLVSAICFLTVHSYYTSKAGKAEMTKVVKDFLGLTSLRDGSVIIAVFDLTSNLWSILMGSERSVQISRNLYTMNILVSLGMLLGACKKYPIPVRIYLVSCLVGLFCNTMGTIVLPLVWHFRKLEWILSVSSVVVRTYFFAVVYSFYVDLLENGNLPSPVV